MSLSTTYKKTVINRLSRFVIEPQSAPPPLTVKNDVRILLNALAESEQKVAELSKGDAVAVPVTTAFQGGNL